MPKTWKVPKKKSKWALTTSAGPHSQEESVPLVIALRESLGLARNKREARDAISQGQIKVDGKVRRDPRYPVGFMDVLEIPKIGKSWRVLFDRKGYLDIREIEEDSNYKLAKVTGKTPFKGGKMQISLGDGRTMIGDFESVNVGDTIKFSIPEGELEEHIPRVEGSLAFITGGRNVGRKGNIKEIYESEGASPENFLIETEEGEFQSPEKYVLVIGEDNPEVHLPEVIE